MTASNSSSTPSPSRISSSTARSRTPPRPLPTMSSSSRNSSKYPPPNPAQENAARNRVQNTQSHQTLPQGLQQPHKKTRERERSHPQIQRCASNAQTHTCTLRYQPAQEEAKVAVVSQPQRVLLNIRADDFTQVYEEKMGKVKEVRHWKDQNRGKKVNILALQQQMKTK